MTKRPYPEEFEIETAKLITERGQWVADVYTRIGVSQHSVYKWRTLPGGPGEERVHPAL